MSTNSYWIVIVACTSRRHVPSTTPLVSDTSNIGSRRAS